MTNTTTTFGYIHRFIPGTGRAGAWTFLLLHGTGGDEHDLLPLGDVLAPGAARLAPRGQVLEHGMPRFFRRIAEGVFDQADLARRTDGLMAFIRDAAAHYGFDVSRVIAAGYSNGANIAASILLRHPGVLAGAVLFRPMIPFEPAPLPEIRGTPVFLASGRADPIISLDSAERLAAILEAAGARVTHHWASGGHALTMPEIAAATQWLAHTVPDFANPDTEDAR